MHHRHPWSARALITIAAPTLGLLVATGSMASASTAHASHPVNELSPYHVRLQEVGQRYSGNWAGYFDSASKFSSVSGKWTEPRVKCTSTNSLQEFWVGLDGAGDSTIEATGIMATCHDRSAHYYTFWEMGPATGLNLVGSSVKAGDKIYATVTRSGTSYTLKLTDSTTHDNNVSEHKTCSHCTNASAEWVDSLGGKTPLSDFGTWNLIGAGHKIMARPSALKDKGHAFSVTWKASS
jgi:hypothetical protein